MVRARIGRSGIVGLLAIGGSLAGSGIAVAHHLTGAPRHHIYHHTATSGTPVYVFGQRGGNILPFEVTIAGDGAISATRIKARTTRLSNPQDTLNGLAKLADAEGFTTLPPTVRCTGTLPDIASRYITVTTRSSSYTVQVHGGCNAAFNEFFATLYNTAGVSY